MQRDMDDYLNEIDIDIEKANKEFKQIQERE